MIKTKSTPKIINNSILSHEYNKTKRNEHTKIYKNTYNKTDEKNLTTSTTINNKFTRTKTIQSTMSNKATENTQLIKSYDRW
jgi:hypothetical protein